MNLAGEIQNLFGQLDFIWISSWDLLILLFFVLISIGYTFLFVTRGRVVPLLVATYMAFVLVEFAPFLTRELGERFGLNELFELRLLAFAIIFLVILFVLSRVILQSPVGAETFGVLASFILSLAQTGFLIAVIVSYLPPEITREFSQITTQVFVGNTVLFYWAVAPVVLLLLLGHKANQDVG